MRREEDITADFQQTVWDYYRDFGRRDLPWRQPDAGGALDPYKIMVSEIMLQQTQVSRVIPKYGAFIREFPSARSLASAELGEVLRLWNGLGYNRRAKYLWQAAQLIATTYAGEFPKNPQDLTKLPGVGKNTAGAIAAYAYNQPVIFVETNIRTVFIHHFFRARSGVSDGDILKLAQKTLPGDGEYREWYWALMDYGTHLKQTVGNLNTQSAVYTRQSPFKGSLRQVRGHVIRSLKDDPKTDRQLREEMDDERLAAVIEALIEEGLIRRRRNMLSL